MTEHVTDVADRAVELLPSQFRDKPKLEAFIRMMVAPDQRSEDGLWQLLTERGLEDAVGVQLDVAGAIVGERRQGKIDADYRRYIFAAIRANKSCGTGEEIITITDLILDLEDAVIKVTRFGKAGVTVEIYGESITTELATILMRFLRKAATAVAKLILLYWPSDEDELLVFATASFLTVALVGGEVTLTVASTDGMPSTGTLMLDEGTVDEEVVTVSAKTATTFTVSAVVNNHDIGASVTWVDSIGLGLGDDSNPLTGGDFVGALE
jgi:hypothetical protein